MSAVDNESPKSLAENKDEEDNRQRTSDREVTKVIYNGIKFVATTIYKSKSSITENQISLKIPQNIFYSTTIHLPIPH